MTDHTILIVDDSPTIRDHIRGVLSGGQNRYRVITASNGLDGYRELVSAPVDLVLCDVMMPVLDGFKFLALKATRPDLRDVPVIMLTSAEEVELKVRALEGGAADYLTKPFHDAELSARLRVHLEMRELQQELRAKHKQLEKLSHTDALTKLTNRRHLLELAEVELLRAAQEGLSLALVILDVDRFKSINDTHGHLAGDRVLEGIAEVIEK